MSHLTGSGDRVRAVLLVVYDSVRVEAEQVKRRRVNVLGRDRRIGNGPAYAVAVTDDRSAMRPSASESH